MYNILCRLVVCFKQPTYSPYCCGIDYPKNGRQHGLAADCKECACWILAVQPFLVSHVTLAIAIRSLTEPSIRPVDRVLGWLS